MLHTAADLPAPPDLAPIRRALLSVSDKTGLVPFAQRLAAHGVELVSTGGTARALRDAGLQVVDASEVTGFPEILDGRVKTLHPAVHGAILARRTSDADEATLAEHGITPIDLVVVNLYPFGQAIADPSVTDATAAENIDIGGPTMVRAAAKNWAFVGVAVDPSRYDAIADALDANDGALGMAMRRELAGEAFEHTAAYDAAISAYFAHSTQSGERFDLPDLDALPREELRYGENPHQRAVLLRTSDAFRTLHGKALSYNNLLDLSAAVGVIGAFRKADPTVAILKHTNPCGVATRMSLEAAYDAAFATDRQSPFGGIVVVNRALTMEAAQKIDGVFTELVIAPGYQEGVLDFLMEKQNRRLIEMTQWADEAQALDLRSVAGGVLVQDADPVLPSADQLRSEWSVASKRQPTEAEWADLDFAWRVAKHVKSNTIVYARDLATMGIGAGQMSRIDSAEIAASKASKSGLDLTGAVVASDAFFPFADGLLAAAGEGIRAVVQPGGSIRDEEVIAAADAHDLAMVFTGKRHFRH